MLSPDDVRPLSQRSHDPGALPTWISYPLCRRLRPSALRPQPSRGAEMSIPRGATRLSQVREVTVISGGIAGMGMGTVDVIIFAGPVVPIPEAGTGLPGQGLDPVARSPASRSATSCVHRGGVISPMEGVSPNLPKVNNWPDGHAICCPLRRIYRGRYPVRVDKCRLYRLQSSQPANLTARSLTAEYCWSLLRNLTCADARRP